MTVSACLDEAARLLHLNKAWMEVAHATNRVFIDLSNRYVCRIHAKGPDLVDPTYTVSAAQYLERCRFPSNRLVAAIEQPIRFGECSATLWEYAADNGGGAPMGRVGSLLKDLHTLAPSADDFEPKRWNIPEVVRSRLDLLDSSQPARRRYWQVLRGWLDRSRDGLSSTSHSEGLIHGDFKRSNVAYASQKCTLLDLDSICLGPAGYDRWRIEIDIHNKRISKQLAADFLESYGYDLPARLTTESFARIARLGHTTLFEFRLANGAELGPRCAEYEAWWENGASLSEIAGWIPA